LIRVSQQQVVNLLVSATEGPGAQRPRVHVSKAAPHPGGNQGLGIDSTNLERIGSTAVPGLAVKPA
jgi:hypothetical protein